MRYDLGYCWCLPSARFSQRSVISITTFRDTTVRVWWAAYPGSVITSSHRWRRISGPTSPTHPSPPRATWWSLTVAHSLLSWATCPGRMTPGSLDYVRLSTFYHSWWTCMSKMFRYFPLSVSFLSNWLFFVVITLYVMMSFPSEKPAVVWDLLCL